MTALAKAEANVLWRRPILALLATRGIRAIADGLVAASLGVYLVERGLSKAQIGWFVTATLLGSALLVTLAGLRPERLPPLRMAIVTSVLMVVLGVAFALTVAIPVLFVLAAVGPLNPGGGDVSAFLPAEQSMLAGAVESAKRTTIFARFSLVAALGAALGGYAAGVPRWLEHTRRWSRLQALAPIYWLYAVVGVIVGVVYWARVRGATGTTAKVTQTRLGPSRQRVRDLTILFSLDSGGGGFVLTSLLAIWLNQRFRFDLKQVGATLATMSLFSAVSALLAPRLVSRFGPVRTMVFTHIPAQVCLLGVALAPNAKVAVGLLMVRALTATLDVPARTAFVMNVVTPEERSAAASFTNIPRALAAAATPPIAGWMLDHSSFGWPLVAGGVVKLAYDVGLLIRFGHLDADLKG